MFCFVSLTFKGVGDLLIPRRWYSQQMKTAEIKYPPMKSSRKTSCSVG